MEKFTIGQSITMEQITTSINDFVANMDTIIERIDFNSRLRHKTFVLGTMCHQIQFLVSCLKQCVFYQLSQAITSLEEYNSILQTQSIRELYFKISTEGKWKKQFQFQQAIICLTKIISEFYNEAFTNITVDLKLQSEIFMILIYIIIGIKVTTRCYPILCKKYFRTSKEKKPARRSQTRKTLLKSKQKRQSIVFSMNKKASMTMSFINQSTQKQPLTQFQQSLKENLFITPLPAIKRQKKQIQSFIQQNQKLKSNQKSPKQTKQLKNIFLSTQISSSLTSQIQKRNLSIAQHNKPFKIKHRNPFYSSHSVIFKNTIVDDNNSILQQACPNQKQQKNRYDIKQWQDTIKNIKFKILAKQGDKKLTRKAFLDSKNKNQDIFVSDVQDFQGKSSHIYRRQQLIQMPFNTLSRNIQYLNIKKPQKQLLPLKKDRQSGIYNQPSKRSQVQTQKQPKQLRTNLQSKIQNYDDMPLTQNQNYFKRQSRNTNYKQLRNNIKNFNNQIRQRKMRIQYSMFMLPSMKNKLSFHK